MKKRIVKNKNIDVKNNEIIKIFNDRNDKNKKYRVEVEQEFDPPMSKKAMQKIKP